MPSERDTADLNERAAVEVMGWSYKQFPEGVCPDVKHWSKADGSFTLRPRFSTDIADAWLLVEKMRERGWTYTINPDCVRFMRWVPRFDMHRAEIIRGTPWAICEAAIAALEDERARKEEA